MQICRKILISGFYLQAGKPHKGNNTFCTAKIIADFAYHNLNTIGKRGNGNTPCYAAFADVISSSIFSSYQQNKQYTHQLLPLNKNL